MPKTSNLRACLLSSYNKLSKPGYDILKTETQGPILASKRVLIFAKLFGVQNKNVLFFMDNLPSLCLIRNYERNYLTYKPFFLKSIKQILSLDVPPENFYYVNTNYNYADIFSRMDTMGVKNIKKYGPVILYLHLKISYKIDNSKIILGYSYKRIFISTHNYFYTIL